jgi:hypothetical protein
LAGVYTFSFLAVMGLFGIGNLYWNLNVKLPRPESQRYICCLAVSLNSRSFIGNVQLNVDSFILFIKYLVPLALFISIMLDRSFLKSSRCFWIFYKPLRRMVIFSNRYLMKMNIKISSQELVFFYKGDDVAIQ